MFKCVTFVNISHAAVKMYPQLEERHLLCNHMDRTAKLKGVIWAGH